MDEPNDNETETQTCFECQGKGATGGGTKPRMPGTPPVYGMRRCDTCKGTGKVPKFKLDPGVAREFRYKVALNMVMKLTRDAYNEMLTQNIMWLRSVAPDTLERRHIELVMLHSLKVEYDIPPDLEKAAQEIEALKAKVESQRQEIEQQRKVLDDCSAFLED